jgi:hypothetical protein
MNIVTKNSKGDHKVGFGNWVTIRPEGGNIRRVTPTPQLPPTRDASGGQALLITPRDFAGQFAGFADKYPVCADIFSGPIDFASYSFKN